MKLIYKVIIVYLLVWAIEYGVSCWMLLDLNPWRHMFGSNFQAFCGRMLFLVAFLANYAVACFALNVDPIELKKM